MHGRCCQDEVRHFRSSYRGSGSGSVSGVRDIWLPILCLPGDDCNLRHLFLQLAVMLFSGIMKEAYLLLFLRKREREARSLYILLTNRYRGLLRWRLHLAFEERWGTRVGEGGETFLRG